MTAVDSGLPELARRHPEWKPWLAVIEEILREAADARWDALVPTHIDRPHGKAPLLAGASLVVDEDSVRRVLEGLIRIGRRSRTPQMGTVERAVRAGVDISNLFALGLRHDAEGLARTAAEIDADPAGLQAIITLLPVPFLQACHRRWAAAIDRNWSEGYCSLCGAWPALAEVRGIERSRYLRCGRCGAEWESHVLSCPYCRTINHEELVTLVPENGRANAVVDACRRCRGYVKTLTRLQGSPPAGVHLDDLATVDLDIAALEQKYERPGGTGYPLTVTVG
jgi:FdhE protein